MNECKSEYEAKNTSMKFSCVFGLSPCERSSVHAGICDFAGHAGTEHFASSLRALKIAF
jgi:hypothetical protein